MLRLTIVAVILLGVAGMAAPAHAQDGAYSRQALVAALVDVLDNLQPSVAAQTPSTGGAIVDFAMGYLGYPYVWAGNGPGGFDCSGFTQFVIANVVGIDIGHATAGQTAYGAWVDWGAWAPGDLVFFANTWGPGISHVGIYIGDGQIIHAENESTGVTISSVYSDYYAGHYAGAYRIG